MIEIKNKDEEESILRAFCIVVEANGVWWVDGKGSNAQNLLWGFVKEWPGLKADLETVLALRDGERFRYL